MPRTVAGCNYRWDIARILVRWEKRADTYIAMLHLACGLVVWRATGLLE